MFAPRSQEIGAFELPLGRIGWIISRPVAAVSPPGAGRWGGALNKRSVP